MYIYIRILFYLPVVTVMVGGSGDSRIVVIVGKVVVVVEVAVIVRIVVDMVIGCSGDNGCDGRLHWWWLFLGGGALSLFG